MGKDGTAHPPSDCLSSLKQAGDDAYRLTDYTAAVAAYTRALACLPCEQEPHIRATLHSNRCLALLKGDQGSEHALRDAQQACRLRPRWGKAHLRLAQAHEALGNVSEAAAGYRRAAELDPSLSAAVGKALTGLERLATRQRCLTTMQGHQGPIYAAAVHPQPLVLCSVPIRLVATAGADATVRLFCSVTGCQLQALQGHQDRVTCVQWSPCSGAWLASASLDGTARLWGVAAETAGSPAAAASSCSDGCPAGAAGAGDSGEQSQAWKPQVPPLLEPAAVLSGHSGRVSCLAFSPDSQLLATGSSEGQVWVWGVARSGEGGHCEPQFKGQCGGLITAVDFSPCGRVLAAASGDGRFQVWSATGEPVADIGWESGPVNCCRFVRLPAGTLPLCPAPRHPGGLASQPGHAKAPQQAPEAALLLTCHVQQQRREGRILLWDVVQRQHGWVDGKLTAPHVTLDGFCGKITSIGSSGGSSNGGEWGSRSTPECGQGSHMPNAFSDAADASPATLLAAACSDGSVKLFDLAAIVAAATLSTRGKSAAGAPLLELSLPDAVLAASSASATWQAPEPAPAWSSLSMSTAAHNNDLVALSPDGRLLAAVGPDRRVLVLAADSGEQQLALLAHAGIVRTMCWLGPSRLLTAGEDGIARVWDTRM